MHQTVTLNNGVTMPSLGFGVYQIPQGIETERAVFTALEAGYRLIDTAAFYRNEKDVGKATRESGIPRKEIFVTTKLHPLTFFNVEKAFYESLENLGLDYIDLYLIHWPFFQKKQVWKVLEKIYTEGYVRAIGVSNYRIKDIQCLIKSGVVIPAVNQVEFHPFLYRKKLLQYARSKGIILEAHTPLTHGKRLRDPRIQAIGKHYNRSPAQILLRWSLQHGLAVIPKATKKEHIIENACVFDFAISDTDMVTLDMLNENYHVAGLSRIIGDRT